jgi:crotonobetainyl-CoA:carnitine CoA-transferase CaiB-like acyl-CoA transferase
MAQGRRVMSVTGRATTFRAAGAAVGMRSAICSPGLFGGGDQRRAASPRQDGQGSHLDGAARHLPVAGCGQALNYLVSGDAPKRIGGEHPNVVPYQAFATRITRGNRSGEQRRAVRPLPQLAGKPELAGPARYHQLATPGQSRDDHSDRRIKPRRAEWMEALEKAGIANGPINSLDQVFEEPQVRRAT